MGTILEQLFDSTYTTGHKHRTARGNGCRSTDVHRELVMTASADDKQRVMFNKIWPSLNFDLLYRVKNT